MSGATPPRWLAGWLARHRGKVLTVTLLVTAAGVALASQLELKSDFSELLPANSPSARELERVRERMGGVSTLLLAVEGGDWKAREQFVERLVLKLRAAIPPERLTHIDYRVTDAQQHFERSWFLYADLRDLQEVLRRLRARIADERRRRLIVDLEDRPPVPFSLEDITRKYDERRAEYDRFPDGYFITPDRSLQAVLLRLGTIGLGDAGTERVVAEVRAAIAELRPEAEGYSVQIGGSPVTAIEERQGVVEDILFVSIACLLLVALAIILYYRSLRALVLLAVPVGVSIALAFAVAELAIGSLTSNTAFLASIIAGNGINFGIILLSRFDEERRHAPTAVAALSAAIAETWRPTLSAAAAASLAYASLGLTDFRGFSQFGLIGGVGIALAWAASYLSMPALLLVLDPRWPSRVRAPRPQRERPARIGAVLRRYYPWVAAAGALLTVGAAVLTLSYYADPFEYDFSKLRSKSASRSESASSAIGRRAGPIFHGSRLQGEGRMVILLDRADQLPLVLDALAERSRRTGEKLGIESIDDVVPRQQDEKMRVLRELRETLDAKVLGWMTPEQRRKVERLRPPADLAPIRAEELPDLLRRPFVDREGGVGRVVYVSAGINAFEGKRLLRVADLLREIELPNGERVRTAGYQVILGDILSSVVSDAPLATAASFAAVLLLVWLSFRRLRDRMIVLGTLLVGIIWMCGAAALLGIKVNMLNFVALPITFGIGVDYPVNVYRRYLVEGPARMDRVLLRTGGAVALCSLTTIIGYGSLLFSDTLALSSFGLLAVVGEVTTLLAALVWMPALLPLLDKSRFRAPATGELPL